MGWPGDSQQASWGMLTSPSYISYYYIFIKHWQARGSGRPVVLGPAFRASFLPASELGYKGGAPHVVALRDSTQSGSGMSARLFRRNLGCLELQLDVHAPRGDHRAGSAEWLAASKQYHPRPTSAELLVTWISSTNRFDSGDVVKTSRICRKRFCRTLVVVSLSLPPSLPSARRHANWHLRIRPLDSRHRHRGCSRLELEMVN